MRVHTYTVRALFEVAIKGVASTLVEEAALAMALKQAISEGVDRWRLGKCGDAMAGQVTVEVRSSDA